MIMESEVLALAKDFKACTKILSAIGDETRQHLILEMMHFGNCNGVRVFEITGKSNLLYRTKN